MFIRFRRKADNKKKDTLIRDFGSGLTVDELIGMTAWDIAHLSLPPGDIFQSASKAANVMVESDLKWYVLMELWEDGHSVWHSIKTFGPVLVRPTGQIIHSKA